MTRVAVILHERRGNWAGQLRTRLQDRPVRWMETRSAADLDAALLGLACPVVLIDLRNDPAQGLNDLDRVLGQCSAARVLVLDPEKEPGVGELARELGAAHVMSGFAPPPEVANLLDRWIKLAGTQIEREGWSRSLPVEAPIDPESWLESILVDLAEKTGSGSASSNAVVRSSLPCGDDLPPATLPAAGHEADRRLRGDEH